MDHAESKNPTLEGRDILFQCGKCGRSLSIDGRGAGLNIRCPQCDSELEVPIPEGFDLAELDKEISAEAEDDGELEVISREPAPADVPSDNDEKINNLMAEIETLRAHRRYLEQQHTNILKSIKSLTREVGEFHRALDDFASMIDTLTGPPAGETQKIE